MNVDRLTMWVEGLTPEEARNLLVRAADAHPHGFTDPRSIGCNWAMLLTRQGYNALPPYARNYLAHKYLEATDPPLPQRVAVH